MPTETPEQVIEDVGRRIAEIRRGMGLTQQQLAEKLRCSVKHVQRLESGMNLRLATLAKLAQNFGISTKELLSEPLTRARTSGRPRGHRQSP